eukprot:XP_015582013.1 protein BREAST CANCER SUSCEPTIBILITY 1 homolog isoform X1 [Ricinus communis]
MGDPIHLEKMGTELKCPICLSLLNSAVSLTCNHIFCNSCIVKSMKSGSNCPVCKVPYQRREVRAAPHMDNLVNIYKSMEAASGFQIFVTQDPPSTKLLDVEKQAEGNTNCRREDIQRICQDTVENQRMGKRKGSRKKFKSNLEFSDPIAAKPSFPTKKRVQVPQSLPSKTPTRNEKLEIKSDENIRDGFKNSSLAQNENPVPSEKGEPVFSPFFWLRDEEDIEKLSQHTVGSQFLDITPPHVPAFSDIKDSDDEYPSKLSPEEEVCGKSNDADFFDSEMFEWTQRACSPELYSTPFSSSKMQDENAGEIYGIQERRQEASLLNSNANEHSIGNKKCLNSEHKMTVADEDSSIPSTLGPKSTNTQIVNDKSNRRGRTARKAMLKKCAKKDVEQELKACFNLKRKTKETMQKEAHENKGDSLDFNKNRKSRKKTVSGTSSTELKHESVLPVSLRGESLNLSDKRLDADLPSSVGENQCDKDFKRNITKICGKISTLCRRAHSLRSKKRKLESIINDIEENDAVQNPEDEEESPSKIDGKNVSEVKRKCQLHSSALSSENNRKLRQKKNMKVFFHGISEDGILTDHQEGQSNTSTKETQSIEMVTDVFTRQTQFIEKAQIIPGSRIQNNPVMLGKLDRANGAALQSCQALSRKTRCSFCLSSEESEASGEMVHYYNGRPVAASYGGGYKVIHSHRNCAEWAPNVYFEDDTAINLEAELTRSRRIKCCCCGLKGAALGCYEKSCRKSFHVTCAKMIPQCRWDTDNFVTLCPLHASSKLPNEDSLTQERIRKKCIPKRQQSNQCNQVDLKDVSTCPSWNSSLTPDNLILCCSGLTVEEREIVSEFQRLSGVTVFKNWDLSVTHVIASTDVNGACKRTLKILMGILEGKWILNIEWVKACMNAMKPVQEDPFEVLVDIHGIRDGPRLGRIRILKKQPKIFEGLQFYFMGDFVASYKGYIQDLIFAGGGTILHRKPLPGAEGASSPSTFIIYSTELPDKCDIKKKDMILNRRKADAEALASETEAKAVSNSWVLNSIAACRLQDFSQ